MNLLGDIGEVHVLPAASRTLDFQVVSVVLVEALEGLDEEEICCEPNRPRQFELLPSMAEREFPDQYATPSFIWLTFREEGWSWWRFGRLWVRWRGSKGVQ